MNELSSVYFNFTAEDHTRNGTAALCTSSFGTLQHLDQKGIQPKTDGTAEVYAPFYLYMHNLNF